MALSDFFRPRSTNTPQRAGIKAATPSVVPPSSNITAATRSSMPNAPKASAGPLSPALVAGMARPDVDAGRRLARSVLGVNGAQTAADSAEIEALASQQDQAGLDASRRGARVRLGVDGAATGRDQAEIDAMIPAVPTAANPGPQAPRAADQSFNPRTMGYNAPVQPSPGKWGFINPRIADVIAKAAPAPAVAPQNPTAPTVQNAASQPVMPPNVSGNVAKFMGGGKVSMLKGTVGTPTPTQEFGLGAGSLATQQRFGEQRFDGGMSDADALKFNASVVAPAANKNRFIFDETDEQRRERSNRTQDDMILNWAKKDQGLTSGVRRKAGEIKAERALPGARAFMAKQAKLDRERDVAVSENTGKANQRVEKEPSKIVTTLQREGKNAGETYVVTDPVTGLPIVSPEALQKRYTESLKANKRMLGGYRDPEQLDNDFVQAYPGADIGTAPHNRGLPEGEIMRKRLQFQQGSQTGRLPAGETPESAFQKAKAKNPTLSDEQIRAELKRRYGV